jgi:hypothetical protein
VVMHLENNLLAPSGREGRNVLSELCLLDFGMSLVSDSAQAI